MRPCRQIQVPQNLLQQLLMLQHLLLHLQALPLRLQQLLLVPRRLLQPLPHLEAVLRDGFVPDLAAQKPADVLHVSVELRVDVKRPVGHATDADAPQVRLFVQLAVVGLMPGHFEETVCYVEGHVALRVLGKVPAAVFDVVEGTLPTGAVSREVALLAEKLVLGPALVEHFL